MSPPRISIAMATYNGARFIEQQLESFAAQTLPPAELVVTDDGSTDGTIEIVDRFASQAAFPVHVHRNPEQLGYTRNFSRAASLCTGDLVCFSDQDDRWHPAKLAKVAEEFAGKPGICLIVNDQAITDADLNPSGATIFGNNRRLGFPDSNLIAGCCTTVRRELLEVLLPFPPEIPYDEWLGAMAELLGVKALIEESLQDYRRYGSNTTGSILAERSPTPWSLFRRFGLADPRRAWTQQIERTSLFEQRILDRKRMLNGIAGAEAVKRALETLDDRRDWLHTRLRLLELSRPRRLPHVFRLWRRGFYARQFGLKSAIKDAVRG